MYHPINSLKLAAAGAFVLIALQGSLLRADPITVTLQSTNTTVTEGNSLTLLFEATNSSSSTYTLAGNGQNYTFVSGDQSDMPVFNNYNFSPSGYAGCSAGVAAGASCYFTATYDTPSPIGETDNDSGVYQVLDEVGWSTSGQPIDYSQTYTNITVKDPPLGATPEPASVAMFATSLAGLGLIRRRPRSN